MLLYIFSDQAILLMYEEAAAYCSEWPNDGFAPAALADLKAELLGRGLEDEV